MLITFISFVVVLSLVVIIHELGHFFTARWFGIKVEEFGLGYPPRMVSIKRGGVRYSLNWIPFGGFVRIKGMEGEKNEEKDSFTQKGIGARIMVLSSGVIMNILMAFFLISIGFMIGLPSVVGDASPTGRTKNLQIQVYEVLENSPAYEAGIKMGDTILSINENEFTTTQELQKYNSNKAGQELILSLKRSGEVINTSITPKIIDDTDEAKLGVTLIQTGLVSYPVHQAIYNGFKATGYLIWGTLKGFYELIKTAVVSQKLSADIAGPVGIAVISGQVARMGAIYLLQFVAILSVALSIINFIPFPALDGGRVLFLLIERIRGKPVNQRVENVIHALGFYLLIFLLIFISLKDIQRFNIAGSIFKFFKNIF